MPEPSNVLDVVVRFDAELQAVTIAPSSITLTNDIDLVGWEFQDLPADASASILFGSGASGPFQELSPLGDRIVGAGNRGPGPTVGANFHSYQARVQTEAGAWSGSGLVINQATVVKAVVEYHGGEQSGWPP